ncbi:MAG: autotransporter-associated beta strand repeat-containing protein [Verrucomicrobiota bacterium]
MANAPLVKRVRGEEAVQALGGRLREVAEYHRLSEAKLRELFQRDKSLWVDQRGRLFYVCEFILPPAEGPVGESTNTPPLNPLYDPTLTFKLHSRPGANRVIFLDFDGHDASTTVWDYSGGAIGNAPIARPFDIDGNPNAFGAAERQRIQYIWSRVAEDYLQYEIDVTTEDPGVDALKNTGTGRYGVRVVIGGDSADWFGSAGGVAYLNSFDDNIDLPCWVFPKSLGDDEKNIAEACSHEAGHTLGLSHDGQTGGVEYYSGQGNWAPIMGVGYSRSIVQWSKGEYSSANNLEDDLSRMQLFGAVYRPDDYGNNIGTARQLIGVRPFIWGIIGNAADVDFFSFDAGAGRTTITASPAARGPNLRIQLSLYDGNGSLIISSNVADSSSLTAGTLPVTISQVLPAGTYYVSVDGIGSDNPLNTGYSDYASLGQYTLLVTLPTDGSWAATSAGGYLWADTANWSSATYPLGWSAIARINNDITGDQNIQIDTPVTLGRLMLGDVDSSHAFTLQASGTGGLRFGTTNGSAWIAKSTGLNDTIAAPLLLQTNLVVTNSSAGDLLITGNIDGPFTLTKYGLGRLVLGGTSSFNQLVIAEGATVLSDVASVAAVGAISISSNALLDVSAISGGWVVATTVGGQGAISGDVVAATGSSFLPGVASSPGILTFSNQLTLNDGAVVSFDLGSVTNVGNGANDLIAVASNLTLNGQVVVNCDFGASHPDTNGPYTLITYVGTLTGGAANLVAANTGHRFTYVFDDSVPGEIRAHVSGAPELLTWTGDGAANTWNLAGATNWSRGGTADAFFQGDAVLFDTGSATPAINLAEPVSPSVVTVSNTANFTFDGGGQISGAATLIKQGSGTLSVITSNAFTGITLIQEGTISIGNAAALGLTNSGTIITNTGQLDLNGNPIGFERLTVSGAGSSGDGVIINSGATQTNAVRNLTLIGNATIGGNSRWDIRGVPASNVTANLTGNGFALTKTGPNQIWFANLGSFTLGNIIVNQGTLGFEGANTNVANGTTLTVNPGATLAFLNAFESDFNRPLVLNSATVQNDSGHNNLTGAITLSGVNSTPVGEAATLDLRGLISGSGGFNKTGPGILRLAGANSYSGDLTISAGTIVAGNNLALGNTTGTTIISSGARLDLAGFNLGGEQIFVAGSGINGRGAIISSLPTVQQNALRFVTLTGDTTFGGNGRWDIRASPTGSLLGGFNLTKVSANEVWLVDLGPTDLRTITINEGTLGFQGTTTIGNAPNTVSVSSGGTLGIAGTGTNLLSKAATFSTGRLLNSSGSNVLNGTVSLTGSNHFDISAGSTLAINGNLSGSGFFNKVSAGTLIIAGSAGATGISRVSAGTLQIGAGGLTGSYNGTLTNNGTLIFDRSTSIIHSSLIVGSGSVIKQNTNVLTLSGANTYSGVTTVNAGTLRLGNDTALGDPAAGTTAAGGGSLDLNGFSVGAEAITISGSGADSAGAIVNSGPIQTNALRILTLAGDATVGGNNRWDVRRTSGVGTLSSSGQPYALTKTGVNTIGLNNITVDTALGDVAIVQGVLSIEFGTSGLGNPAATIAVSSNAALNLHSLFTALDKAVVLADGGKLSHSGPISGGVSSTVSGLVTLAGGNAFVENSSPVYPLQINGAVSGSGNFNLAGTGLVQMNGLNSFSGATLVNSGVLKLGPSAALTSTPLIAIANGAVLDVSSLGGGFVLNPAQTLSGSGTIVGSVIANGTVSPGASVGRLTISGNTTLAGTTLVQLNKSGAALTNDELSVTGTLTCGGTVEVARGGDPLALNDSFRLFSAGVLTGSFTSFSLPALNSGLTWNVSTLNSDGWLRVVSNTPPMIGSVGLNGHGIVISGSGGAPGAIYFVMTATDVTVPLPEWSSVATNIFDPSGNFAFTNTITPGNQQQFFRLRVP